MGFKDIEKQKAYLRKWYIDNKEDVLRRHKEWRAKDKSKETCVYYLPEEHYIGITDMVMQRMQHHRAAGKITEGLEIIAWFDRRVDAHYVETLFHMRGYNGFARTT